MNKQDIDKAAASLTQAINFFSPMVVALNGADEVFSSLANATNHKAVLTKEVEKLKKTVEDLKAQAEAGAAAVTANDAAVIEAKAAAEQSIADARQQAQTQVTDILNTVTANTNSANAAFAKLQSDIATQTENMQKAYADEMAALGISKQELEASIKVLETKLDKLKEQAKKFAASFVVE